MIKITKLMGYLLLLPLLNLSGCYYQADLQGQTAGSFIGAGGMALLIGEVTGDLVTLGGGIIAGSIFGGMIGQEFDNRSPLMLQDPVNDPIPLYYYETIRAPLVIERFYPGQVSMCP